MGLFDSIGKVIGVAGDDLFGGVMGLGGGYLQNEFNRAEAAKNRSFQKQMSSTSYQRAMADMAAAGINPMLAYQQGGASSPSGSMASAGANVGMSALQGMQATQQKNLATAQEVSAIASAKSQTAQARLTKANQRMVEEKLKQEKRTTAMLERKGMSMPEIQYTPKNMLFSQGISAIEQAIKSGAK